MRRFVALVVTALGIGLLAPAGTAQAVEYGPHVKVAKVIKDAGRIGVFDNGDIIRIRFSAPVAIPAYWDLDIGMLGANGNYHAVDNDIEGLGFTYQLTENDTLMTLYVNFDPSYSTCGGGSTYMTYPIRLAPIGCGNTEIFDHIQGRKGGFPINETKGDLLINKG